MKAFILSFISLLLINSTLAVASEIEEIAAGWRRLKNQDENESYFSKVDYRYNFPQRSNQLQREVDKDRGRTKIANLGRGVICWNEQYAFVLKRDKSPDSEFRLTACETNTIETNTLLAGALANSYEGHSAYPRTWFFKRSIIDAFDQGHLIIDSVNDLTAKQIRLSVRFLAPDGPLTQSYKGHIDCDRDADYSWRAAELVHSKAVDSTGNRLTVKMSRDVDEKLRIANLNEVSDKNDSVSMTFIYLPSRTQPEDYRLSKYGFPEPAGVEWKKPMPNWLYWVLGGCCFIFLSLILTFYSRRLRRKSLAQN